MNQRSLIFLASCVLFVPIQVTWPQTTQPGVDPDIPPGTETPQGDVLLQGKAPQPLVPEIQPGTETPRAGDTGMAPGTGPLPGTRNSGDEDDIEDLEVERQTVKGGGILQDVAGASPAAASPHLPGQPASGILDLPAVGMKPKDADGAGGGEPQPAPKTTKSPTFRAGKDAKDGISLTGEPTRRENCGTVLTGWIDDPDADVNPCPAGCERGEQLWVKTYESGDTTQYEASYQCYMPAVPTLSMPADAPSSGENCGTYWTGWMDTLDAGVNPCPQGCLRGQKPSVKTGLSGHGIKYDVNYQCYMPEIPTLSMPADAPSSGENCGTYWTGWMDTLDTTVNPCPQNCVRGQQPTVKTGLSGHGIKYDVNYQCYTATTTMAPGARAPRPITQLREQPGADILTRAPAIQDGETALQPVGAGAEPQPGPQLTDAISRPPIQEVMNPPSSSGSAATLPPTVRGQGGDVASRPIDTSALSQHGPRSFDLAGFNAGGTSLPIPTHSFNLAGFTASGTSLPIPSHSFELAGFSASGTSLPIPSHNFNLAGFTASGTSGSAPVLPSILGEQREQIASRSLDFSAVSQAGTRNFELAGFTANGASLAIPSHSFTLAGFTASGTSLAIPSHRINLAGFTASGTSLPIPSHSFELVGWRGQGSMNNNP